MRTLVTNERYFMEKTPRTEADANELHELLAENERLKAENRRLKALLESFALRPAAPHGLPSSWPPPTQRGF